MEITFDLSKDGINKAVKELDNYAKSFEDKVNQFREKVAEYVAKKAQEGFNTAQIDERRSAQVSVTVENNDNISVIIANGEDAVWVEFGAGIYYNGAPDSSPHPRGVELGMIIGSYGKGRGKRKAWGFYDGDEVITTHGTPAKMPMFNAVTQVCNDLSKIAEEVFK